MSQIIDDFDALFELLSRLGYERTAVLGALTGIERTKLLTILDELEQVPDSLSAEIKRADPVQFELLREPLKTILSRTYALTSEEAGLRPKAQAALDRVLLQKNNVDHYYRPQG